jgi:SAM-dependent methyltransferase
LAEAPSSAFSQHQYDSAYPPGIERHWWMRARASMVAALVRENGGAAASVLEIGCGAGATLLLLRARGLDCRGVEIANVAAREDVRAYVTTNCDALALPEETRAQVRTILLLDVIEHIDDADAFLSGIARSFPGLRRVVVTAPARPEIWSNYDEYYGHKRRYDLAGLRNLGEGRGWRVRRAGYAFRLSYPPALALALLKQPRATELSAPSGFAALAHRALAALTLLEWRLLPAGLFGSSAMASFDV